MTKLRSLVLPVGLFCSEGGQTMAEYSVVLAVLTVGAAAVFTVLSGGIASALTSVVGLF